jgi:hypothetical protein
MREPSSITLQVPETFGEHQISELHQEINQKEIPSTVFS